MPSLKLRFSRFFGKKDTKSRAQDAKPITDSNKHHLASANPVVPVNEVLEHALKENVEVESLPRGAEVEEITASVSDATGSGPQQDNETTKELEAKIDSEATKSMETEKAKNEPKVQENEPSDGGDSSYDAVDAVAELSLTENELNPSTAVNPPDVTKVDAPDDQGSEVGNMNTFVCGTQEIPDPPDDSAQLAPVPTPIPIPQEEDYMDRELLQLLDIIHERPLQRVGLASISSLPDSVSDYENHSIRASIDAGSYGIFTENDVNHNSLPYNFPDTPPESPTRLKQEAEQCRSKPYTKLDTSPPEPTTPVQKPSMQYPNNEMPPTPETPVHKLPERFRDSQDEGLPTAANSTAKSSSTPTIYSHSRENELSRESITYITYPATTERVTTYSKPIVHEIVRPHVREIVNHHRTREVHSYEYKPVCLPMVERHYLPPKHIVRMENGDEHEISREEVERLDLPVIQRIMKVVHKEEARVMGD